MQRLYSLLSLAGILAIAGNVAWAQVEEPLGKLQTEGSALLTFENENTISQNRGTAILLTNTDVKATSGQSSITLSNGDVIVLDQAAEVAFAGTADAPEVTLTEGVIAWYGETASATKLNLNGWSVTDQGTSAAICSVDSENKIVVQGVAGDFTLEKEGHETIAVAPGDIVKLLPLTGDDVDVVFVQDEDPFVQDEVLPDDEIVEEEDDDEGAYLTEGGSGDEFLLFGLPGLWVVGGVAAAGVAVGGGVAIAEHNSGGGSSGGQQTTPPRRIVVTPVVDNEPMQPMDPGVEILVR